ncbi:hypothetical protein evm_007147 [Chilo suppressalis]|nr:hypothetical protein evm_007147 [Chilo suppressalis]
MVKIPKGKSREEQERKTVARRERYKKLKADPERSAIEQEKKREVYLKQKIQNKVKSIKDMSPREQRVQRRRWKESSKRYLEKNLKSHKLTKLMLMILKWLKIVEKQKPQMYRLKQKIYLKQKKTNLNLRKKCLNDRLLREIKKSVKKIVERYYEDDIVLAHERNNV